jgi:hypothetical protein
MRDGPAVRDIGEYRPKGVLPFVVDQDDVPAVFILERVLSHFLFAPVDSVLGIPEAVL